VTYVLRHVDAAGTVHAWLAQDSSAHWVARWHARDSGRPTEVWRDGVLVTTWYACGEADPPYNWQDGDDGGGDASESGLRAPESAEQDGSGRAGCTKPVEAVSEGDGGPVWVQPVINYAAL
jgi:hypothetical protein